MTDVHSHDPRLDLPRRSAADTTGHVQRTLEALEKNDSLLKILTLLANSTSTFRPFVLLSNGLMNLSPLPEGDREAMIMYVAVKKNAPYEWAEHHSMAQRAGLTVEQLDGIKAGDHSLLSDTQRFAIKVADDVLDGGGLSEERWQEMVATWGEEASLDLVIAIAWWGAFVATILEAIGLRTTA
jgi:alkylhydroperoxidase family enzyme